MSKKKIAATGYQIAALTSILFVTMGCLPVQAQHVYKCVKNGKTSFQGAPCEAGSVVALQPNASRSQLPWEGLRPGMSVGDVRRMVADVVTESKGTGVRLRKQGITIAGIAFNAAYDFDGDERLESVQVTKVGEINNENSKNVSTNDANLADYEKLVALMRTKYGAKISSTIENGAPGSSRLAIDMQWAAENGRVSLSITPRTATTSILSFEYRPGSSPGYQPEPSRQQPMTPVRRPVIVPSSRIRRN
ncbi:MAG: hypothetical protein LBI48_11775 [Burkholderiaceae bacterium]|jgi:hypothetical protein|nr:hypothetical protein [Burkholderiaceae bacterium]